MARPGWRRIRREGPSPLLPFLLPASLLMRADQRRRRRRTVDLGFAAEVHVAGAGRDHGPACSSHDRLAGGGGGRGGARGWSLWTSDHSAPVLRPTTGAVCLSTAPSYPFLPSRACMGLTTTAATQLLAAPGGEHGHRIEYRTPPSADAKHTAAQQVQERMNQLLHVVAEVSIWKWGRPTPALHAMVRGVGVGCLLFVLWMTDSDVPMRHDHMVILFSHYKINQGFIMMVPIHASKFEWLAYSCIFL